MQSSIRTLLSAMFIMICGFVHSTNYYWIATSTANWNTGSNWSTTSGGAGGAVVPGSGDIANFDGAKVGNCTIDAAVNVAGFVVAVGYSGTISQGANAITIGTSNASFSAGTFTGGSSSITINGTFTLSGTAFTSTSNTLTFASTVTNSSGTFTHNSGTVSFSGTGTQIIPAWNFYNLTSASSGARTLASSGTIGIVNTFTKGTNSYSTITGSTIDYKGTGAQTIASIGYNNLTLSGARGGANITLANIGTISIAGTFSITATSFTLINTSSTVSYNGTGAQTILTLNYNNLTITGAHTTNNITLASTGLNSNIISIGGSFTNSATFTSGVFVNTSSTVDYNSSGAQTIAAFNYNNLTVSGTRTTNNVTLASTGVIGIAGTFSKTVTFTSGVFVNTGSTINYNGTGAQTVIAFDYNNLTIAGARTSNSVTLANSGTIGIARVFNNFATFTSGAYVNAGSTVDFNGTLAQTITAIPYNNLTSSSSGERIFASTGTIGIAGTFTKGTNTYTNLSLNGEGFASQNSTQSANIASCTAVDASTAFVTGDGGVILKTTDGGTTWAAQSSTTTTSLRDIEFYDANNGLAIGTSGLVLKTINGGSTWASVTSGTAQTLSGIYYISSSVVLITCANGTIIKSTDAGATWSAPISTGTAQALYGMYFTDANTGYVVGNAGVIYKTVNAGANWTSSSIGVPTSYLYTSVYFTDAITGYAVGYYSGGTTGIIIKTTDAGATWTTLNTSGNFYGGIGFVNASTGYVVGGNVANNTGSIFITRDAGLTWTTLNLGTNRLGGMEFTSSGAGFISGLNGEILKFSCCNNGSTVDYNGTGAQTVVASNYYNLTLSGVRTTNSITLASSGTIGIAGALTKTATFTSGSIVNTSSTVDLNGNLTQSIPAFTFNNLTTNNTGKKSVTGNVIVNGTLNLTSAEIALAGYSLTMTSNTYTVVTKTTGYISTTGGGKLSRPTASVNAYVFPMGYRSTNDSADYFTFSLTPGKTAAQNFEGALNPNNTGFVITHDKALHGSVSSKVTVTVSSSSYNPVQLEYDINTSANISAVRVTDQNDNTLKTMDAALYTITDGNKLNILNVYQLCLIYSKATVNSNLNWSYEISYDGNGYPVSEQIQYMDLLGRPTQTQVRNLADNTVLATQTVYDTYGRAALQTLPVPIGSVMAYQNKLITNSVGNTYTYTDFDKPATSNNYPGEINNPSAVGITSPGTLGWYYSDNNTLETYQATTSYPYSRAELTGAGRKAAAGDEYRMGAGKESKGYSMVSGTELKFIFGTNKSYKDTVTTSDKLANNALTITGGIQASKTISVDADGKEVITYNVGGLPIASCYTGITGACSMTTVNSTMEYAGTSSVDIHLPSANKSSLKLLLPSYYCGGAYSGDATASDITFKITNVATNTVLVLGTDYTVNAGTRAVTFLGSYATGSSVFRISFVYTQSFINSLSGCTVPDVLVSYDLDYSRWSVNYYDLAGRLRKSVSPKGINCSSAGTINFATTYDYSSMGQLIASKSADEGLKEMTYDDEGKPRFIQDAVQSAANKFSYVNYDSQGRMMENGEYTSSNNGSSSIFFRNYYGAYSAPFTSNTPSTNIINNIGNTGMLAGDCGDFNNIYYYPLASAEEISASYTYKSSYSARYTMGKVCKTKNANSATWYGYNQAGQTVFTVQQLLDADNLSYNTGINNQIKTIDYTYNAANGTLSDQTYEKNGSTQKLKHTFTYDAALRLIQVNVAVGTSPDSTRAKYYYYKTGALKRKELGDKLQGIDYIYTVNGQLKSINNPALDSIKDPGQDGRSGGLNSTFGKDMFGLALDYHTGDYIRTGSNVKTSVSSIYNGMISAQRHKTRSINNTVDHANSIYGAGFDSLLITGLADEIMRKYTYDDEYRLSTSVFGKFNNSSSTFTGIKAYKEWGASAGNGINYDANGNITSLKRNAYNGTAGILMDDFTYTYTSNTNKLASIIDAATSTYNTDFDAATSQTFSYNGNGQTTADQAESASTITYYNTGLLKNITFSNNNTTSYWYDAGGKKIKTKYFDNGTSKSKLTWYINDANGTPLAIYEYDQADVTPTFKVVEQPLYGSERIGTLDKANNIISYEITDHLGNVRAVISGAKGTTNILASNYFSQAGNFEGWTTGGSYYSYVIDNNKMKVTVNHDNDVGVNKTVTTIVGHTYQVTFDLDYFGGTAFNVKMDAKDEVNGTWYGNTFMSSAGTYTYTMTANSITTRFKLMSNDFSGNTYIMCFDNIVIKDISIPDFTPQLLNFTDYYAFGGAMPGRSYNLNTYRYNYQGQETSPGTNWQAFELRMLNSDLGRWMSPDPMGQFHSPYISMGNNPVSGVDPDGGYVNGGTEEQWNKNAEKAREDFERYVCLHYDKYMADLKKWYDKELKSIYDLFNSHSYGATGTLSTRTMGDIPEIQALNRQFGEAQDLKRVLQGSHIQNGDIGLEEGGPIEEGHTMDRSNAISMEMMQESEQLMVEMGERAESWAARKEATTAANHAREEGLLKAAADKILSGGSDITADPQQGNEYTDKIRTPTGSPGGQVFTAEYRLGSNDAQLTVRLQTIADRVDVSYTDGDNTYLLFSTPVGLTLAHNYTLQDYAPTGVNLAGMSITVTIIGQPAPGTTEWSYKFSNSGGSLVGYSNGFNLLRNQNNEKIINWGRTRDTWR